ncbi:MAG: phosphocholine cytidylyltransferase family protein [Candidatus Aminicenantes bacterium]|nr:phosphocholine cytidylyltransferase family protein [Candidatus Aminicenantes bacterium]
MAELKAVVLCAGRGRRLAPLTENRPKCLLPIGNKTILEHILDNLDGIDPGEIILVTGFKSRMIEDLVSGKRGRRFRFVLNENYSSTNTAYSLNRALRVMDSDFILINGDVFFDKGILAELVGNPQKNCVVVDRRAALNEEEVKVMADGSRLVRIGKDLEHGECLGEAIGINKLSKETIRSLRDVFDDLEAGGECHHFFEIGIDRLISRALSFGIQWTEKAWIEIDTIEDYHSANDDIYRKLFP